jgi:hypothetical protein
MDSRSWDERYAATASVQGGEPNRFVAAQFEISEPGRALDLGAGEGRNATWLAVHWTVADLRDYVPAPAGFDAVIVAYLHLMPLRAHDGAEPCRRRGGAGRTAAGGRPRKAQPSSPYTPGGILSEFAKGKENWIMCRQITCRKCGKATWAGCGQHIDEVMRGIPKGERCAGHEGEPSTGFFARLFGR